MDFLDLDESLLASMTDQEVRSVIDDFSRTELFRRMKLDPQAFSQQLNKYHKLCRATRKRETMATAQVSLPLPVLPAGWAAEKDFKALGQLSPPNQRNIEPVGPHFLAHARRVSPLKYS